VVCGRVAIIATDIAEVIGTAIGLNLLFGIPLEIGVLLTALDVFLILYLQRLGFRYLEALIITLLGVIAVCFCVQIAMADPHWGEVIRGFRADHRDRAQPRHAVPRHGHPRRHGDAAQSLPALGHRADPRLSALRCPRSARR
jgi:Mn2+/Fe2+ NRAMP family transporter